MKELQYIGTLSASKSIMNRILITQSFFPDLIIEGKSDCDDVKLMQNALAFLGNDETVDCGHAGTVIRFLSFRLARIPGLHKLKGSAKLMSRPQEELLLTLRQLGCKAKIENDTLLLESQGWKPMGDGIHLSSKRSSQFLSGLLLSSWKFDRDILVSPGRTLASPEYWAMTLKMMKDLGMRVESEGTDFIIRTSSEIKQKKYKVELDMSSAFSLAAFAAVRGSIHLQDFPEQSIQPDGIFPRVLQEMGVGIEWKDQILKVKAKNLEALDFDINLAPDMFPVLCVLTAHAHGRSRFVGGEQLKFKESDRLKNMIILLQKMNKKFELREGFIEIEGDGSVHNKEFVFDCLQDHRLAMAAGLVRYLGYNIKILNSDVVSKSFPKFWDIVDTAI